MHMFPLPNKIMKKTVLNKVFTAMIAASLAVSAGGMTVNAADDSKSTTVKYEVTQGYEWTIHSDIDFGKDKGVNQKVALDSNTVSVTKNIIPDGKKLQITVKGSGNQNAFAIANGNTSLNYTVAKGAGTDIATGGTVLELAAGTNTGAQALTFTLNTGDSAAEVAGAYTGTVTYTAAIVAE